jgi:hypothetical protein
LTHQNGVKTYGSDVKFVSKIDILGYVCHLKSYFSLVLKMWQNGRIYLSQIGERENTIGHR